MHFNLLQLDVKIPPLEKLGHQAKKSLAGSNSQSFPIKHLARSFLITTEVPRGSPSGYLVPRCSCVDGLWGSPGTEFSTLRALRIPRGYALHPSSREGGYGVQGGGGLVPLSLGVLGLRMSHLCPQSSGNSLPYSEAFLGLAPSPVKWGDHTLLSAVYWGPHV
jgi:hypothetical protein